VASVCIHGLLAFSIRQYNHGSTQQAHQHFSITFLTLPKGNEKKPTRHAELISTSRIAPSRNDRLKKNSVEMNPSPTKTTAVIPSVMYNPAPMYPASAKAGGQEGEFSVKLWVNTAGDVAHAEVISIKGKKELFEEELLKTIKTWKFTPSSRETSFEIPISFRLD
jgi:TonB family protein